MWVLGESCGDSCCRGRRGDEFDIFWDMSVLRLGRLETYEFWEYGGLWGVGIFLFLLIKFRVSSKRRGYIYQVFAMKIDTRERKVRWMMQTSINP